MVEESEDIGSYGGAVGAVDSVSADDAVATTATYKAVKPPSAQDLQDAVAKVNNQLSSFARVLELQVDPGSGLTIATVRDSVTGVVLSTFPSTDSLHLAQMLAGWAGGKNALLDLIA